MPVPQNFKSQNGSQYEASYPSNLNGHDPAQTRVTKDQLFRWGLYRSGLSKQVASIWDES